MFDRAQNQGGFGATTTAEHHEEQQPKAGSVTADPVDGPEVRRQPTVIAWPRRYRLALGATDFAAIIFTLLVAHLLAAGIGRTGSLASSNLGTLLAVDTVIAGSWLLALALSRSRARRVIGGGLTEYRLVMNATLATFGILAAVAYLTDFDIGRTYLVIALPLGLAALLIGRVSWRQRLRKMRRAGRCLTGAFIIGSTVDVQRCVRELRTGVDAGYKPIAVAFSDGDRLPVPIELRDLPRVPFEEVNVRAIAARTRAVMVAGDLPGGRRVVRDLGRDLEDSRIELILVSRVTDVAGPRIHFRRIEGLPMVHVDLPHYSGAAYLLKRLIDLVLAGMAIVVLSPVMAVLALWIKLDSPGPALFRQERVGIKGSRFTMFKFRSMVVDAEAKLTGLEKSNEGAGVLFKMRRDPRITRSGAFIRKSSLDELPQLFNVLRGEMSIVGPRPPLPAEVARYEQEVSRRLLIKPGITGLWQVSGRSDLSWEESVKLDLYYVENWSVTGDLLIMIRTVRAVFASRGAY